MQSGELHAKRPFADLKVGDALIEVKNQIRAIQQFRAATVEIAYKIIRNPRWHAYLVLVQPEIMTERLLDEQRRLASVLHPQVANRIHLIVTYDGRYEGFAQNTPLSVRRAIERLVRDALVPRGKFLPRPSFEFVVRQVLIHQYLMHAGPMTINALRTMAGCSYPTVAHVLKQLTPNLARHSNRRIELARFPMDDWSKMVAVSETARGTVRFADRSGIARSPEQLVRRMKDLKRSDVAVGGALAARHYDPDLDLIGTPRLDLSIHAPRKVADLGFIERLDPALKQVDDPSTPANLAIHFVRRQSSYFVQGREGLNWADPVECLLDLHEARLEAQAAGFLKFLLSRRGVNR